MRLPTKILFASILIPLAGCVSSNASLNTGSRPTFPPLPANLRSCFASSYQLPPEGVNGYSNDQVVEIIGQLIKENKIKSSCGNRLIAWYNSYGRAK